MEIIAKETIEKYIDELNEVRQDFSLLKNYEFEGGNPNHIERLRLNIALFNDFNITDYSIAKFLFEQESNWRRSQNYYDTGEVDNLYFSALLVSRYQKPEMVINFFETKMIDFDCGIGFDGEFLLSNGKEETFSFLSNSDNEIVNKIYKHIGSTIENCGYKDEELGNWKDFKLEYFKDYILPIKEPMWFLYSVKEKSTLRTNFQKWIDSIEKWDENKIHRLRTFSEYLGDKENHIRSLQMILEHSKEAENGNSYWAKKLKDVKSSK